MLSPADAASSADEYLNYELIDGSTNRSSGPRLGANIAAERQQPHSTTTQVVNLPFAGSIRSSPPAPASARWSVREIEMGRHIDIYRDYIYDPHRCYATDSLRHCVDAHSSAREHPRWLAGRAASEHFSGASTAEAGLRR